MEGLRGVKRSVVLILRLGACPATHGTPVLHGALPLRWVPGVPGGGLEASRLGRVRRLPGHLTRARVHGDSWFSWGEATGTHSVTRPTSHIFYADVGKRRPGLVGL